MYRQVALGEQEDFLRGYISSIKTIDPWIYDETILVILAHTIHLYEKDVLSKDIAKNIVKALLKLRQEKSKILELPYEDVHEALEAKAIENLGDKGAWVNLGKSRNDQVATAIRMKIRTELINILNSLIMLRETLIKKAEESIDIVLPYYTHYRPAQISTLAHYFLSVEEALQTSWRILFYTLKNCINICPQGSAACASTTVPMDRERLAYLLGFEAPIKNTLYATSTRDFILYTASALVSLLIELSRAIEDLILWSMPQINYVTLSPHHVSTSSIMPHKRNPVTLEITRARIGDALGDLVSIIAIYKSLMSGYNLDLQEITKHIRNIIEITKNTIDVLNDVIRTATFNKDRMCKDAMSYPVIASDIAEQLSLKTGEPFRKAYFKVAKLLAKHHDIMVVVGEINNEYNLEMKAKDIKGWLLIKKNLGSPNPEQVKYMIKESIKLLSLDKSNIERVIEEINARYEELNKTILDILSS